MVWYGRQWRRHNRKNSAQPTAHSKVLWFADQYHNEDGYTEDKGQATDGCQCRTGFETRPFIDLLDLIERDLKHSVFTGTPVDDPYGDLFVVYNHNIRDFGVEWDLDSNGLTIKVRRAFRF